MFGSAFGLWDYEWILEHVPPHMLATWEAFWLINPWDGANRKALGQTEYKPPPWLRKMIADQQRIQKARAPKRFLTGDEMRTIYEDSQAT